MSYNSRADVVCLLADRSNTKSNIKLGGFRSQLQASYMTSHTEELWYNETVGLWMTVYIYIYIYILLNFSWYMYVAVSQQKIAYHSKIFIRGFHLRCLNLELNNF